MYFDFVLYICIDIISRIMKLLTIRFRFNILFVCLFVSTNSVSQTETILSNPFHSDSYKTVSPYISYDETKLVFIKETEDVKGMAECFKSPEGAWSEPVMIEALNSYDSAEFDFESPTYNHDASEIYFSMSHINSTSGKDIYVIKREKDGWTKPEKLSLNINSNIDETDPFISADDKFLFFARSYDNVDLRRFKCYQIFVSEKKDNIWQIPILLPDPVNSGCDRCPRLAPDGKSLYFASVRDDGKTDFDIYYAKKITKNAWMSPIPIDTVNNTEFEMFPSISKNGKTLYYMKTKGLGKKDISNMVSTNLDFQFQPEKSVRLYGTVKDLNTGKPIFADIQVIDPNTSAILSTSRADEKTGEYSVFLPKDKKYRIDIFNKTYSHNFFTYNTLNLSENKDVQKDIELYSDVRLILNVYDNEIFEPLDAKVSVYEDESGTEITADQKTIKRGMYSLTLPIGRSYKIKAENSHFETDSFFLDLSGVVQFSEFERDLELQVKKVDYFFKLTDEETGEGVEAFIEIINLTTNERIVKKVKTDADGNLKIKLRDGTRYEINISPQGYAYYNTTVDLIGEDPGYRTDAKLTPLKKQTKLELNNIYFETNSADLNKNSFEELNRVVTLLKTNPQIKIEISAHTDDIGSEAYNLKLSDRRANSVKLYLFGKDISEDQIISKGYGESKPAYLPANTDENRAKNRRVELEVIDIKSE